MRRPLYTLLILTLALSGSYCSGGSGGGAEKAGPTAMAHIAKSKQVRIALDAVNLPFEWGEGTGVQGFDVDIGLEIGKDIGHDIKWVKMPFERLFEILKNGEAELVISAISITPERQKEFAFSEPYFDSSNTIAKRKTNEAIKDLASLSGKKVGVQSSTTGHKFTETQKTASNVTIVKYTTLDDALGGLNRGEVDAVIGDEPILTYSMYKSFPNLMTTGTRLTSEQYGVMLRKEEKELLEKVNNTISRLKKSGELEKLRQKWFQNVMEETSQAREALKKKEGLKELPKTVSFNFVRAPGSSFNMSRLDGFTIRLVGANGTYASSPILTDGPRGSCRIGKAVPPGQYQFSMPQFQLNTTLTIPKTDARSVTFDLTGIGGGGLSITMR